MKRVLRGEGLGMGGGGGVVGGLKLEGLAPYFKINLF